MKRKEKAAVDEFVALVGGKTWEPVRHKCMGKWSGMTDYGFVIDLSLIHISEPTRH